MRLTPLTPAYLLGLLPLLALIACQQPMQADLEWIKDHPARLKPTMPGPDFDPMVVEGLTFFAAPTLDELESLRHLPELRQLTIWDEGEGPRPTYEVGKIDDQAVQTIAGIEQLESLTIAGWDVRYTDQGLTPLVSMPSLNYLNLTMATNITDDAMNLLAKAPKLTTLSIVYTDITDIGLRYLLQSQSLRKVIYAWTPRHEGHRQHFLDTYPDATFQVLTKE